jgi:hypothetical protein
MPALSDKNIEAISRICSKLEKLNISNCTHIYEGFYFLSKFEHLTELSLATCTQIPSGLSALSKLKLRHLDISGCSSLTQELNFIDASNLESLNISNLSIVLRDSCVQLKRILSTAPLRQLFMVRLNVSTGYMKNIPFSKNLRVLDASHAQRALCQEMFNNRNILNLETLIQRSMAYGLPCLSEFTSHLKVLHSLCFHQQPQNVETWRSLVELRIDYVELSLNFIAGLEVAFPTLKILCLHIENEYGVNQILEALFRRPHNIERISLKFSYVEGYSAFSVGFYPKLERFDITIAKAKRRALNAFVGFILPAMPNLKKLFVSGQKVVVNRTLEQLPHLKKLTIGCFRNVKLRISVVHSLTSLVLFGIPLNNLLLDAALSLPSLANLELLNCMFSFTVHELPRLRELHIACCTNISTKTSTRLLALRSHWCSLKACACIRSISDEWRAKSKLIECTNFECYSEETEVE